MRAWDALKRFYDVGHSLVVRSRLDRHDTWTREQLEQHQRKQLSSLVSHAVNRSPFYKKLYSHLDTKKDIALKDLPIINKTVMMENFDSFVTDPRLKLPELQAHIGRLARGDEYYLGEYRVLTTSGSSGLKGVFVSNRREWSNALATYYRCGSFMGVKPRLPRWKMASVLAGNPMHVSYRIYASSDSGIIKARRLEATTRLDALVEALNAFQPQVVAFYPSVASLLAVEQIEGRLRIHPRLMTTGGELRTEDMEEKIRRAWGIVPYNSYGMTEAGAFLGSDCSFHRGIHVFEDLFITEVVDEKKQPVPDGVPGTKLLITNLFNYTQPLIRYEVSDMIGLTAEPCPCGRPLSRVTCMEGRSDDILYFKNSVGSDMAVHPLNFRSPLAAFPEITEYQIVQEPDGIDVFIVLRQGVSEGLVRDRVKRKLQEKLESLGAHCPDLRIRSVQGIERDHQKMGKLKLVKCNVKKGGD